MIKIVLKTTAIVLCLIAGLFVLVSVMNGAARGLAGVTGIEQGHFDRFNLILLVFIVLLPFRHLRIRRKIRLRGSAVVALSPEQAWDALVPRVRKSYYAPFTAEIREVEDEPLMLEHRLSKELVAPGEQPVVLRTRRATEDRFSFARHEYVKAPDLPWYIDDAVASEYHFEPVSGGTKVTLVEEIAAITPSVLFTLLFVHPCKDSLKSFKAHCDGKPDESWAMATLRADEGGTSRSDKEVLTAGLTACAVLVGVFCVVLFALGPVAVGI